MVFLTNVLGRARQGPATRPNPKKPKKKNRAEWVKAGPRVKRVINAGSQGYTWAEAGNGPSPAGTRTRQYWISKNDVVLKSGETTNPRSNPFISFLLKNSLIHLTLFHLPLQTLVPPPHLTTTTTPSNPPTNMNHHFPT
ncbi:hypothetical protein MtrunA17_Chr6g0463481 [Medicago truncatula]|uniref:Uncharacterized protein n=1 Tax=Medicago truncatula TaxID=3880 RepID=G7ZXG3_MEDTR|nr:hypothetical protein MTR_6g034890 [Medicago truncatula]RHN50985.1 hypothetical protein MtrunA17_Chr6g0463481 [Medicago truncatula]